MAEYKEKQRAVFPAKTSLSLRRNDMEQIAIQEYLSYCEEKIMALYRPAGWKNYTSRPELLKSAFSNSLLIPAAWEEQRPGGFHGPWGGGLLFLSRISLSCRNTGIAESEPGSSGNLSTDTSTLIKSP